jgi:hypothetical protein
LIIITKLVAEKCPIRNEATTDGISPVRENSYLHINALCRVLEEAK